MGRIELRHHLASLLAVAIATMLAVWLKTWFNLENLVLIYVVAVVATGLRFGALPAMSTALLSLLGFNFFLTEPRFTFSVHRQDDVSTLMFLLVIALICGQAASRIRRQFLLLKQANHYSESLRRLAQTLASATDEATLARGLADELAHALPHHTTASHLQQPDLELRNAMLQLAADARQRLQLAQALESARIKGEVEQLRSALLASVSHDLRSPLSAMMGAADSLQLLDQQLSPDDRHELIDTISQECRRLDRYIQNLLDMTRLGHGTLKIERDWVSASDIIGSALARLKRCFPAVQTEYRVQNEPPLLYAHAALIEQALFNILENAARFSPPDAPIRVTATAQGNRCCISIEDQGPGIPDALRDKIFDMFYVVADGDLKKHNTGMGLAICRGMIGAHGGSVQALPGSQGKGTRFVVDLPVDPTRSEEHQ